MSEESKPEPVRVEEPVIILPVEPPKPFWIRFQEELGQWVVYFIFILIGFILGKVL